MQSERGSNAPRFRDTQLVFTAHVRDPINNRPPEDIEARRMRIYVRLIYNNIEGLLALRFGLAKNWLGDATWHEMVRAFIARHTSSTPHFREIPQEFLEFLDEDRRWEDRFPYLLEFCHYKCVKLALDISVDELPDDVEADSDGPEDLLDDAVAVSPLAWSLCYEFPVHLFTEAEPDPARPAESTYLIGYRGSDDEVHFLESNEVTARLLTLLSEQPRTGREALAVIADELSNLDPSAVLSSGTETLQRLRRCAIIYGSRTA
jgi:hypothetical protein